MGIHGLGIFTWVRRPTGENLGGIVLQRLMAHRAWRLALLSYLYRPLDCHPWGSGVNTVFHCGSMGPVNESKPWSFHSDEEGHVLWRPVPSERIRVEEIFDVGALFGF